MRTTRHVALLLLALAAVYSEVSLISTWRLHIAQVPGLPNYTSFTSVWTFFWPCTVAIVLIVAAPAIWLRAALIFRGQIWFELAYFLIALYFFFLLHRTIWFAYDPSHSGPAL